MSKEADAVRAANKVIQVDTKAAKSTKQFAAAVTDWISVLDPVSTSVKIGVAPATAKAVMPVNITLHAGGVLPARFAFRGIDSHDVDFDTVYAKLGAMNLNHMACQGFAATGANYIARELDKISAPNKGFIYFGSGYTAFTHTGAPGAGEGFGMSAAQCQALMTTGYTGAGGTNTQAWNHPRNSHVYKLADEINLSSVWGNSATLAANLAAIKARVDLIHSLDPDPSTVVLTADYRQQQLDPASSPGAVWVGVLDEVWLSGYPSPNVDAAGANGALRIPNQAAWCDAAGLPYSYYISCHRNPATGTAGTPPYAPDYPTDAQFVTMMTQIKGTNAKRVIIYVWDQDGVDPRLSTDPGKQALIGTQMGLVM